MTDHYEHNIDDHEDPAAGSTSLVGFIGTVLLVVTMLGVTALYYNIKATKEKDVVVEQPVIHVDNARIRQEQRLTDSPHWEERDDGGEIVRELVIPIDRAMAIVAAENGGASSGGKP